MCPIFEDQPYSVQLVRWQDVHRELTSIRFTVFVREQGVPAEIEIDPLDADPAKVVHALARDLAGEAIGTGRMMVGADAPRIGRMAVLNTHRRMGVGAALLELLCKEALRRGCAEVHLHAQISAAAFYARHGFHTHGAPFVEAGIVHQEMRRGIR